MLSEEVAVVIAEGTHTRELVDASGELVLSVPTRARLDAVGSESGRDEDKWARSGLRPLPASKVGAPLVDGCVAWLECRVLPEPDIQRKYDRFICEVTVHHLADGVFFTTGERVQATKPR